MPSLTFRNQTFYDYLLGSGPGDPLVAQLVSAIAPLWRADPGWAHPTWPLPEAILPRLLQEVKERVPERASRELKFCLPYYFALCPLLPAVVPAPLECLLYFELNRFLSCAPIPGSDPPKWEGHSDHVPHALKVLWVAHSLLTALRSESKGTWLDQVLHTLRARKGPFDSYLSASQRFGGPRLPTCHAVRHTVDERVILLATVLASLFHDLGYVDRILRSQTELSYRYYPGWLGPASAEAPLLQACKGSFFLFCLERAATGRTQPSASWDRFPMGLEALRWGMPRNHGYAGACILLDTFKTWRHKRPRFWAAVQLAAAAVGFHDLRHEPQRPGLASPVISFNENPIGYVLYLADQLQLWGRLKLKPNQPVAPHSAVLTVDKTKTAIAVTTADGEALSDGYMELDDWCQAPPEQDAIQAPLPPPNTASGHPSPKIHAVWFEE